MDNVFRCYFAKIILLNKLSSESLFFRKYIYTLTHITTCCFIPYQYCRMEVCPIKCHQFSQYNLDMTLSCLFNIEKIKLAILSLKFSILCCSMTRTYFVWTHRNYTVLLTPRVETITYESFRFPNLVSDVKKRETMFPFLKMANKSRFPHWLAKFNFK